MTFDEETEQVINEAAERAVGLYREDLDDRFGQVFEALDSMKVQVDKIPKIEEDVAELKSDMKTVKLAIKDTNRELREMNDSW